MVVLAANNAYSFQNAKLSEVRAYGSKVEQNLKDDMEVLDVIANELNQVNEHLVSYSLMSKTQKFFEFFKGNYFKMRIIRDLLPTLIEKVNNRAITHFRINETDFQHPEKEAGDLPSTQSSYLQKFHLIKKIQSRKEQVGIVETVSRLAQSQFSDNNEILEYVKAKKEALEKGEDVALPRFFHATKEEHLDSILNGKTITIQDPGYMRPPGVYVSTNDESEKYGPYTFALTNKAVYPYEGSYFVGREKEEKRLEEHASVWVCVKHDVALSAESVAHIAVDDFAAVQKVSSKLPVDCKVPVITRESSRRIAKLFDQAIAQRKLPETWQGGFSFNGTPIPSNIVAPKPKTPIATLC